MQKNVDKIYAEALYEMLEKETSTESVVSSFLNILKDKSHLYRVNKIIKEFEKIYNQKNNIAKLKVTSAYSLDKEVIDKIAKALNIFQYELEMDTDSELIGGFVARYNDNLIDLSIKNNLNKLNQKLKQ
tara:strand:+ start:114 stop:500 length:387 start_codon:yes stop_codon:yes gene_type:complete